MGHRPEDGLRGVGRGGVGNVQADDWFAGGWCDKCVWIVVSGSADGHVTVVWKLSGPVVCVDIDVPY